MKRFLLFWAAFFLLPIFIKADLNPDDVMSSLLETNQHPRVLNTLDLPEWNDHNPQPFFTPEGDFNKDGQPDIAISGIYDLPKSKNKYFLLIASVVRSPLRTKLLFLKEYDNPVFIHQAGTTGEGDPGNQAFSISFCWECSRGEDFYWDKKNKRFEMRDWTTHLKHEKKLVQVEAPTLPQDVIDKSLKMVGILPDIKTFVANLKKRNGELGTRVDWEKDGSKTQRTIVYIFEKKEGKELLYDQIGVDLKKKRILSRSLRGLKTSQ